MKFRDLWTRPAWLSCPLLDDNIAWYSPEALWGNVVRRWPSWALPLHTWANITTASLGRVLHRQTRAYIRCEDV